MKLQRFFSLCIIHACILGCALKAETEKKTMVWLFIGDSHSVRGFGDGVRETLFTSALVKETDFYQYSVSGSTINDWHNGKLQELKINAALKKPGSPKVIIAGMVNSEFSSINKLVQDVGAQNVIIALGTNDFAAISHLMKQNIPINEAMNAIFAPTKPMLSVLEGKKCFWILPPKLLLKEIPEEKQIIFYQNLKHRVEDLGCKTINSREFEDEKKATTSLADCGAGTAKPPKFSITPDQKDGIHFFSEKGRRWGTCAAYEILELLKDAH